MKNWKQRVCACSTGGKKKKQLNGNSDITRGHTSNQNSWLRLIKGKKERKGKKEGRGFEMQWVTSAG